MPGRRIPDRVEAATGMGELNALTNFDASLRHDFALSLSFLLPCVANFEREGKHAYYLCFRCPAQRCRAFASDFRALRSTFEHEGKPVFLHPTQFLVAKLRSPAAASTAILSEIRAHR